jgi:hypothetical protein
MTLRTLPVAGLLAVVALALAASPAAAAPTRVVTGLGAVQSPARAGRNVVVARFTAPGRRGSAIAPFTLVRPVRGLARIVSPTAGTRPAGPLVLAVRARTGSTVQAWVNGRAATTHLRRSRAGIWSGVVPPSAGLRHRANRVRVRVWHPSGQIQDLRREVRVATSGPIADAGRDLRTTATLAVRLDGRASLRAPGTSSAPAHAWRITSRPRGSSPRLTGATTARPVLRARQPGRYVLRHTVRGPAAPPTTGAAESATAASSDEVTVTVATPGPLVGLTVGGGSSPGLVLGGSTVPAGIPGPGVQLLVLDRATLAVQPASSAFPAGSMDDLATAVSGLQAPDADAGVPGDLAVIVSLPGGPSATTAADAASLNSAVAALGGRPVDAAQPFQVVGSPTAAAGSAWQVPTLAGGFFTPDINGLFTFVWGDDLPFATGSPSASGNVITVGGTTFSVPAPAAGNGGFQVAVLDGVDPTQTQCFYFTTNDPASTAACTTSPAPLVAPGSQGPCFPDLPRPCTEPQPCLGDCVPIDTPALSMGYVIANAVQAGDVVIVRSIGTPFPASPAIGNDPDAVLPAIQAAGGTVDIFDQLTAPGGQTYTLVSPGQPGTVPVEASSVPGPPMPGGGVSGVLQRADSGGAYQVLTADPTGQVDYSSTLTTIAYQPPQAWPASDTPGRQAALASISARLAPGGVGCDGAGDCDVRNVYGQEGSDPSVYSTALAGLRFPAGETGFTQADFTAVKEQLALEFPMVKNVWTFIGDLQAPFTSGSGGELAAVEQIGAEINQALQPPPTSSAQSEALSFLSDFTWALSIFEDAVPVIPELAGGLSVAAAFGADLTGDDPGAPTAVIDVQTQELATTVSGELEDAGTGMGNLGEIIVADWGKLSALSDRYDNDPGWQVTPDVQQAFTDGLQASAAQGFYTALMPVAFDAWELSAPLSPPPAAANYSCVTSAAGQVLTIQPFAGITPQAQITVAQVPAPSGAYRPAAPSYPVLAMFPADAQPGDDSSGPPPASLVGPIFAPPVTPQGDAVITNGGFFPAQWFWDLAYPAPKVAPAGANGNPPICPDVAP